MAARRVPKLSRSRLDGNCENQGFRSFDSPECALLDSTQGRSREPVKISQPVQKRHEVDLHQRPIERKSEDSGSKG